MNALLTEALHAFSLDGAPAAFIRHHENLTYQVDGRYLLRIHQAAEGLQVDHNPDIRHAELAFLHHLANKGMQVQRPVAAAMLPDGTMATLLTWLEGHPQAYDLGECEFHLAFEAEDYDAAHKLHEEMGCICYENPAMGIYFITDPDGYWLEVVPAKK